MAAASGLGLPAGRLVGHHTDAAPIHSLLFRLFPMVTHIYVQMQSGDIRVYWLWLLLYVSAVSVVIVIIVICDMPRHEFSLREHVYIQNTYMKFQ